MKVNIKNMVCNGTRFFVIEELERLGLKYNAFASSIIDFKDELSLSEMEKLRQSLREYGLELTLQNINSK